jgi:terminase large subunit-like protein
VIRVPDFKWSDEARLNGDELSDYVAPYLVKLAWFQKNKYTPHYWQALFHCNSHDGKLTRFRHLVAGRRGGKTLSAAWEVLFYCLNPEYFHLDAHGESSDRALWCWALAKNSKVGFPSKKAFRECINAVGLIKDKEYTENRTEGFFEFPNGSRIDFKSADDPESLRGAGLDILWIDESAFIPNRAAFDVVRPSLSDKLGILITTTTPDGKNWFYDEFWSDAAFEDLTNGRVEYTSIHNPHFPRSEWEYAKRRMHPLLFKKEYVASFDSMAGRELSGEWLHYFSSLDVPNKGGRYTQLDTYIGVDPAISIADDADRFVMSLVGVEKQTGQTYLLEQYVDRIPFPEQVDKIREWHLQYRPMLIGIESNAYQAALAQAVSRIEGLPPVIPILAREKKSLRIKIRESHIDFIDEWIDYDSTLKNPKDDCLDSVEIALRVAGALLPIAAMPLPDLNEYPAQDQTERARRAFPGGEWSKEYAGVGADIGEW